MYWPTPSSEDPPFTPQQWVEHGDPAVLPRNWAAWRISDVQTALHQAIMNSSPRDMRHLRHVVLHPAWARHPEARDRALTHCAAHWRQLPSPVFLDAAIVGPWLDAGARCLPTPKGWLKSLPITGPNEQRVRQLWEKGVFVCLTDEWVDQALRRGSAMMFQCAAAVVHAVPMPIVRAALPEMWDTLDKNNADADGRSPLIDAIAQRVPRWLQLFVHPSQAIVSWNVRNATDRTRLDMLAPHLSLSQIRVIRSRLQEHNDHIPKMSDHACPVDMPNLAQKLCVLKLQRATKTAPSSTVRGPRRM